MFKAFDTFWYVIDQILDTVMDIIDAARCLIRGFLVFAKEFESEANKGVKKAKRDSKKKKAA